MILLARLVVPLGYWDALDATPPLASFFGFRSRTLIVFLVSFLCAILFFLAIYFGLFLVVLFQ